MVTYNSEFFESEIINRQGIEYRVFHNDLLTIGIVNAEDIEIQVTGSNYNEVLEVILNLNE